MNGALIVRSIYFEDADFHFIKTTWITSRQYEYLFLHKLYLLLPSETVHNSGGCCPQNRNMRGLSLLRVHTIYASFRNAWWYEQVALLLSGLVRRKHFYEGTKVLFCFGSRPFEHWTLKLVHSTVTTCCLRCKPENTYPRKIWSGTGTVRVIFEGWNFSRPVSQLLRTTTDARRHANV